MKTKPIKTTFYMCGFRYTLTVRQGKNHGGLCSCEDNRYITITLPSIENSSMFSAFLIHELTEATLIERYHRYYNNSGCKDYTFWFTHSEFSGICEEVSGALKQLLADPRIEKLFLDIDKT